MWGSPGREEAREGFPKFCLLRPLADRWTMHTQNRHTAPQLKTKGSGRDWSLHARNRVRVQSRKMLAKMKWNNPLEKNVRIENLHINMNNMLNLKLPSIWRARKRGPVLKWKAVMLSKKNKIQRTICCMILPKFSKRLNLPGTESRPELAEVESQGRGLSAKGYGKLLGWWICSLSWLLV